ncbi:MAG: type II secretion system protein GspN [Desulfopila sp.]
MSARHRGEARFSWLGGLGYGLVLTVILLIWRFPADTAERYLERRIATVLPGVVVEPGTCSYGFPFRLLVDTVRIVRQNGGEEIALVENASVVPVLTGFGRTYTMQGQVYGGTLTATMTWAPLAGALRVDAIELSRVALDRSPLLVSGSGRQLRGFLDFSGRGLIALAPSLQSDVQGTVTIDRGGLPLRQRILSLTQIEVDQLRFGLVCDGGVVRVSDGILQGPALRADFAGEVRPAGPFEAWSLQVHGNMALQPTFASGNPRGLRMLRQLQKQFRQDDLPFQLDGDIGNPRFRFGRDQ